MYGTESGFHFAQNFWTFQSLDSILPVVGLVKCLSKAVRTGAIGVYILWFRGQQCLGMQKNEGDDVKWVIMLLWKVDVFFRCLL